MYLSVEFLITVQVGHVNWLIGTRLIRSFTLLFEVSVKCFPIIFLSFRVQNAQLIHISTYFEGNPCRQMTSN